MPETWFQGTLKALADQYPTSVFIEAGGREFTLRGYVEYDPKCGEAEVVSTVEPDGCLGVFFVPQGRPIHHRRDWLGRVFPGIKGEGDV
jgi:hypothetical protein